MATLQLKAKLHVSRQDETRDRVMYRSDKIEITPNGMNNCKAFIIEYRTRLNSKRVYRTSKALQA